MKSVSATFFAFLYLLAMVRPVVPLFEYLVDQDYIAEFLCINKDKVELQCKGKCYLMQQLNEQNEEKEGKLPRIAMEEYPIGFVRLLSIPCQKSTDSLNSTAAIYRNDYRYLFSYSDFHPPTNIF